MRFAFYFSHSLHWPVSVHGKSTLCINVIFRQSFMWMCVFYSLLSFDIVESAGFCWFGQFLAFDSTLAAFSMYPPKNEANNKTVSRFIKIQHSHSQANAKKNAQILNISECHMDEIGRIFSMFTFWFSSTHFIWQRVDYGIFSSLQALIFWYSYLTFIWQRSSFFMLICCTCASNCHLCTFSAFGQNFIPFFLLF